ncbi:MAG: sugar transferase [Bacteroidetes bacterium]|nr:sugar transferase [Bacteroidota bacterium]
MEAKRLRYSLILLDWLSALISWGLFYYYRKIWVEHQDFQNNPTFIIGLACIPFLWLFIYFLQGTYVDVRRMHRLRIFALSFQASLFGVLALFFLLLIDDAIVGYQTYYKSLGLLFGIHLTSMLFFRIWLVSWIVHQIHKRKYGFKTLLIGGSEKAMSILQEIKNLPKGIGNEIVGFVNLNGVDRLPEKEIPYFGHIDSLEKVMMEHQFEEVIIALESTEHERLRSILARVDNGNVKIKIISDMYDILSGTVKMTNIFGAILTEVNTETMPDWQQIVKRILDIVLSLIALVLLIPVYITLAFMVKFSSKGPIFFTQERVGLRGKLFSIYKFRTMYVDAEKGGPQLSSQNDPRITPSGKIMRKMRLDEFPQFYNVLIGDMSLVGPRPEREFFIDQIKKVEPQFLQLTKVRPGITSWGQVKFGYAENVEQMLQRMKYDLLYLRNRTLALDFKIMLYTVMIILKGSGK